MADSSRRDQGQVRVIAMLDMILSLILFGFYLTVAFATKTIVFQVPNGPFSKTWIVIISLIIWTVTFAITYLQLSTAYRLFLVTFQDALGPAAAVQRCLAWFQKLVWFFWVLCVIELLLRFFGMYFVREFCDDLKHHIRITTSSSAARYSKDQSVPQVVVCNHVETV